MRKDTRSTRFQRSPFILRATSTEGTRMTRLRQANQLGSLSRQRNTFSSRVPSPAASARWNLCVFSYQSAAL